MNGDEVIPVGDILVSDGRIKAFARSGTLNIPSHIPFLDAKGMTILPGYIDVHDHIPWTNGIHPQQSWMGLARLAHGITASRDPNPHEGNYNDNLAYSDREFSGQLLAPRLFTTSVPYHGGVSPAIESIEDARELVRLYAQDLKVESFKVQGGTDRGTRRLLSQALREAGLNGTVHIDRLDTAMTVALDGENRCFALLNIEMSRSLR